MQKLQIPWSEIAKRLTEAVRASPLSTPELAAQAKVQYHSVYRIRLKGVKNRRGNALALCKFFKIPLETAPSVSADTLAKVVLASWDGTPEHGQLLMDLARCAGQYSVTKSGGQHS